MPESKFKCVRWHSGRSAWLAQIAKLKIYKLFDDEADAAEHVRKALKCKTKLLKDCVDARASGSKKPANVKFVYWVSSRQRWLCNVHGKCFKYFVKKSDAVALARKHSSGVQD